MQSLPPPSPELFPFVHSIRFQARFNPYAPAVIHRQRQISYGVFWQHIARVTQRLAGLGLAPGSRVGVSIENPYLHWLAVLGLMRLGITSASLAAERGPHDLVGTAAALVEGGSVEGRPCFVFGDHWLAPAPAGTPEVTDRRFAASAVARIVLSPVTAGTPRKVALTFGDLRLRALPTARTLGLNPTARVLQAMKISSIGGFAVPASCWSAGGAVVFESGDEPTVARVLRTRPNVIFCSTGQLEALLDQLPPGYFPVEQVSVFVAGGVLPPSVSRRARQFLSQRLFQVYASSEAGIVALSHASLADARPGFSGIAMPTAEVEIVDRSGVRVPEGHEGEIRVRSDGMAKGYLDDPEASAAAFRDGWFHSGDLGVMDADGGLTVLGRLADMMNFGGAKVLPDPLESHLSSVGGVVDLAVFTAQAPGGPLRPALAVVAGEGFSVAELIERFRRRFHHLPEPEVVHVHKIPRNEMGKVMRKELAAIAAASQA